MVGGGDPLKVKTSTASFRRMRKNKQWASGPHKPKKGKQCGASSSPSPGGAESQSSLTQEFTIETAEKIKNCMEYSRKNPLEYLPEKIE